MKEVRCTILPGTRIGHDMNGPADFAPLDPSLHALCEAKGSPIIKTLDLLSVTMPSLG